jgi:hypothetical protein
MNGKPQPANLRQLAKNATWRDLVFVLLTFLPLAYAFYNLFSVIRVKEFEFDYMFVTGAGAFIWGAWRIDRIGEQLPSVLERLDQAGSIVISEAERKRLGANLLFNSKDNSVCLATKRRFNCSTNYALVWCDRSATLSAINIRLKWMKRLWVGGQKAKDAVITIKQRSLEPLRCGRDRPPPGARNRRG